MENSIGINMYGYFNQFTGLSEATRTNFLGLKKAGIQINVKNFDKNNNAIPFEMEHDNPDKDFDINLVQININVLEDFLLKNGEDFLKGKYNIACWAWEFLEPPVEILGFLNFFNEIWMPSNFCVEPFSHNSPIPVLKFGHAIKEITLKDYKPEIELPEKPFIFLSIFDSASSLDRKNPFAVLEAFEKAFGKNNEAVFLVIKTANFQRFEKQFENFKQRVSEVNNILLVNEYLEREELESLIQHCNSLVSLHRSEGFGLTMAEAMSYEKPVIATGYSGNLDFMNVSNSFLVKYEMISAQNDFGFIKKGFKFADPSVDHAAELMQKVASNTGEIKQIAQNAKRDILNYNSIENIGNKMKDRLFTINTFFSKNKEMYINEINRKSAEIELEIRKFNIEKKQLLDRISYLEKTVYNKMRKKINVFFKNKRKKK